MSKEPAAAEREERRPGTDAAAYAAEPAGAAASGNTQKSMDTAESAAVRQYLAGLAPELNYRLFCDLETGPYGFPEKIFWVEGITVYAWEEQKTAGTENENNCPAEMLPEETGEKTLAGQIKYRMEQIKKYFTKLWKKKER